MTSQTIPFWQRLPNREMIGVKKTFGRAAAFFSEGKSIIIATWTSEAVSEILGTFMFTICCLLCFFPRRTRRTLSRFPHICCLNCHEIRRQRVLNSSCSNRPVKIETIRKKSTLKLFFGRKFPHRIFTSFLEKNRTKKVGFETKRRDFEPPYVHFLFLCPRGHHEIGMTFEFGYLGQNFRPFFTRLCYPWLRW